MTDDVLVNKLAIIERCIKRIREEYVGSETEFFTNPTKQDSIILNLQRACESAIDLSIHIIRLKKLGIPQNARNGFELLEQAKIIPTNLSGRLKAMVGFRNIAVHAYQKLDLEIVKVIVESYLDDLIEFNQIAVKFLG